MVETITIRAPILEGNLSSDPLTRAAVERLASETKAALQAEFPGATIECPIRWKTSGDSGLFVSTGDSGDEERARRIADRAWIAWAKALTDSDVQ